MRLFERCGTHGPRDGRRVRVDGLVHDRDRVSGSASRLERLAEREHPSGLGVERMQRSPAASGRQQERVRGQMKKARTPPAPPTSSFAPGSGSRGLLSRATRRVSKGPCTRTTSFGRHPQYELSTHDITASSRRDATSRDKTQAKHRRISFCSATITRTLRLPFAGDCMLLNPVRVQNSKVGARLNSDQLWLVASLPAASL